MKAAVVAITKNRKERAVEMPGLWKAWKAKSRLPPLSTSPLEISPKGGAIPTFPQLRRRGGVEKREHKKKASPSFHEPLGNLTKRRRDSHISTAPAARADGKVENQKQVSHFPTAPNVYGSQEQKPGRGGAAPSARRRALHAA